jgi:hypothetical protein
VVVSGNAPCVSVPSSPSTLNVNFQVNITSQRLPVKHYALVIIMMSRFLRQDLFYLTNGIREVFIIRMPR